ncbi:hypothetical protein FNV43_RR07428 [Rhamnella rubrinervis]|uniref:FCP1 homology domain-containing protein n=1 Tax=Rhamnella rubrinervis TaxID=2594499 RepID=A0A8K0HGL3_9ROSA|nr:hypothetical protein FNV43_RR07428 [Rhamnella rubrinervis]
MVSKITKKTPPKCIKDCRNNRGRHRRRSPVKKAAVRASSAVIATINKSIFTCHRRLLKIFSKLARIGSPNRNRGYKILTKTQELGPKCRPSDFEIPSSICRMLVFDKSLPPMGSQEKRTVFLDLDETLVHSSPDPPPERFDFVVRPRIEGEVLNYYVLKRPGVDEFLEALADRYEVVVFTAGLKEYASLVLDRLDRKGVIAHRLYRDSCKEVEGRLVKDLSELGRELKSVVIVDDNPNSYMLQPGNAVPVRAFVDDMEDRELSKLVSFFKGSDYFDDMRDAVKHYFARDDAHLDALQL